MANSKLKPKLKKDGTPAKQDGRPSKIGPKEYEDIERLAGLGLTLPMIAARIGISERQFDERRTLDPEVSSAIKRGRAKAQDAVANSLFNKAINGDVNAIRWWEMTRTGRSEKTENTHEVVVTPLTYEEKLQKAKEIASKLKQLGEG